MLFSFNKKKSSDLNNDFKSITENLYKQNSELAEKNKIFSLLRKLYQISILTLDPEQLSAEMSETVRDTLEFELVSIFVLDDTKNNISPLALVTSNRLEKAQKDYNCSFSCVIPNVNENDFFKKILQNKLESHVSDLGIWSNCISPENLKTLTERSNIKALSGYPLIIEGEAIGTFIFCLNRPFENLTQYEKESISSVVDIISVALNKSYLYRELKATNSKLELANENLHQLDRQKSEFLSLASHQLRGPLTSIKGYSSMIIEGDFGETSPQIKDAVSTIFSSTENLVVLVNDYLDISRIEQGGMKYDFTTFDLGTLVKQVHTEYIPVIQKAEMTSTIDLDATQTYLVNADQGKLKQVVSNLLDNSIKYSPKGNIIITLKKTGVKVCLSISDNGIGIEPEMITKLFQKFNRSQDANKVNVKGTGLGLYLVKQLVEAHHGRVWVDSKGKGKGSTFTVELNTVEK